MKRVILTTIFLLYYISGFTQMCWNSLSYDQCKYRVLTETSLIKTINFPEEPYHIEFGLGIQKNLADKYGVGMLLYYDFRGLKGIGLRLTRLLNSDFELQLTPRIYYSAPQSSTIKTPGYGIEAGINWKNFLGIYVKSEFIEGQNDGKPLYGWGIKASGASSSIPGILAAVGIVILVIALN